jgi:haloalkane dehalogenase
MKTLRTPDSRFADLPDYPFAPHYLTVRDADGTELRLHYVDEGPREAAPVLLMHGEPSWSFLYRKMITGLAAKGHRAVAPDLIGFGKSDKPTEQSDYTFERHVRWMSDWLIAMKLENITLFCQDWGGLIGLRLVAAFPQRFARVVVGNTGLPIGTGMNEGFKQWLNFSQSVPELPIGEILAMGTKNGLSDAVKAAYVAPFPDETYKAGARRFPALVPVTPEHGSVAENKAAWEVLGRFNKPFLTAFSDSDPVTKGGERIFQERVPGRGAAAHDRQRRRPLLARRRVRRTRGHHSSFHRQHEVRIAMKVENAVYPSGEQLTETVTKGSNTPIVMLNLLKFKDQAKYKDGTVDGSDGRAAYNRYGMEMLQFVTENGGKVLFMGDIKSMVIGQVDEVWDAIALVEYPSSEAFVKIAMSPHVAKIGVHREAGLAGQLLIQVAQRGTGPL